MRLKYRAKEMIRFLRFAFYPRITLITCFLITVLLNLFYFAMLRFLPENFAYDELLFALVTGATASFFVTLVVELSCNYKNNKLAWYELQSYYEIVVEYESMKHILMKQSSHQRAEKMRKEALVNSTEGMRKAEEDDDPKDIIQSTWELLPRLIPVFKDTLETKKMFLTDAEIFSLQCIMVNIEQIRREIRLKLMNHLSYNALNHPDEKFLLEEYPQNIIDDMPVWMRKHIAGRKSDAAIDRVAEEVLSDSFLLKQYLEDYDISVHGLESYVSPFDDDGNKVKEDADYTKALEELEDFWEAEESEETFRERNRKLNELFEKKNIPFVSRQLSCCCLEISKEIEILEQEILKKPYAGQRLLYSRNIP